MSAGTPAEREPSGILNVIVRSSIRHRGVVVALAVAMAGYGVTVLRDSRYDVFPEFAPPQAVVQTEAPGLAPEEVEVLVTQPVENALNGAPGVEKLRSTSIQGVSIVTVVFEPSGDIYRDRQGVTERLASLAGQLPAGVSTPSLAPLTSSTSTVLIAGLTSETRSLMDLRTIADWTIRPRLLAVPGVAKVAVFGGEARQIQIRVHPDRLIKLGLGLNDVLAAAQKATGVRGAGFVETENQRIVLKTEGQSLTAAAVARTLLVSHGGAAVTLSSVADVVDGPEPPIGAAAIMGRPAVTLDVSEQYGAGTQDVTRRVEAALEGLRPSLAAQGVTLHAGLFRPASFIETATKSIRGALLLGGVLVVVVLFVFLFDLRTALISCTAIPLSLLAAVVVMRRLGLTLDTMTLGGLAIAIGEVVDDSVIDVENIVRRLRENSHLPEPRPPWRVVLDASLEVRSAVVYATFAVVFVFLPILTMSGVAGRLFAPLGIAYILAVLASLAVALTVTPALSMAMLSRRPLKESEPPVVRALKTAYTRLLSKVERRPRPVLVVVALLAAGALALLPTFGAEFLPELKEGHFVVHMSLVPGTSLVESIRTGGRATRSLLELPFVRSVSQQAGRAEKADDTWGPHYSELQVDLKPLSGKAAEEAPARVRDGFAKLPGVVASVKTFLTERVEETLTGYTASVVVNLVGDDLDALDRLAAQAEGLLKEVKGATEVQVQSPPGLPQVVVRLRGPDLLQWGFTPVEVLDAVRTAYQGAVVGQVYEGNRVVDVTVVLDPEIRRDISRLGELPLRNGDGVYVRLSRLADVFESDGRYQILHQGARRVQTVTANVAGRDVGSFVTEARSRLSRMTLPPGVYLEIGGTADAQARSRRDILLHSALAGLGIVILLSLVTRHPRNLALVLANMPFALVGGVLAVFATGGVLSVGTLVGFVTLFGITLRNSILMISHYEHLVGVEGATWGVETAIRGAADRLSPIVMTSVVTALGLLPLAIGMGEPGREIEGPMAVVILGGLATSLVLNLLVLPALALRFGRFERRETP